MSSQIGFSDTSGWALILPTNSNGNFRASDAGIFYPCLPDLPIARMMFLAGIAVAALGVLGLPGRRRRAGGCAGAAAVITAGRGGGGRDRRRAGQHRPADGARHGHPRPARRGQRPADRVHPGLRPGRRDPGVREPGLPPLAAGRDGRAGARCSAEVAGLPGAPVRATQVAAVTTRPRPVPRPACPGR